jgi:hypothetical protein
MGRIKCQIYPSVSSITYPTIIVTGYDRIYAGTVVRIRFANLKTLPTGVTDYCTLGASLTYFNYGGTKGYIYQPVSFVVGPPTAPVVSPSAITFTVTEQSSNYVGELANYTLSGSIANGFTPVTTNDYFLVTFPQYTFEGIFNLNFNALCSLASGNQCSVFGRASQIYIAPSATVSASAFSFTIKNLLNAAYQLMYVNQTVVISTIVGGKLTANGSSVFLKFTQASLNASGIITSLDSIYGGDSGINYYFVFQLNSYLPPTGKIAIFFPSIYISLFTVNSKCFLRSDSQALAGPQAYCSIINQYQLVIVPNGALLSGSQPYYLTVTNITNPNLALSSYKFSIQTYYSPDVYNTIIISSTTFASPSLSLITVKQCQLQVTLSIYNANLPSQYQISLICPTSIKQASELQLYLSWSPSTTNNGTCSGDSTTLYSTQCNILTSFINSTKITYLSIFLRQITAQKLITITGTIPNGNQGSYVLNASINFNGFVYLNAVSNSFYITTSSSTTTSITSTASNGASSVISSTGQAISIRSFNYPLNRYFSAIYTFAITNPKIVVSTLQILLPSSITSSQNGIACAVQPYRINDDYFNLMFQQGTNVLTCSMIGQQLTISGLTPYISNLTTQGFLYITVQGLLNPATSVSQYDFTFTFINTTSTVTQAVLQFSLPLSYSISNPPTDMQIANISLSSYLYYVNSYYTMNVTTVSGVTLTIVSNTTLGIVLTFPQEYALIWSQITPPTSLNLTIGGVNYTSSSISLATGYLFARFNSSAFTSQLTFSSFSIGFQFRNPN